MSTLSSYDRMLLKSQEYDYLEHAVEMVGNCRPDFILPPINKDLGAEITHEQSEAVIDLVRAAIELDVVFSTMVKERLEKIETLSDIEIEWLTTRKQTLKKRKALGKTMLNSIEICTAFLDFINPHPLKSMKSL